MFSFQATRQRSNLFESQRSKQSLSLRLQKSCPRHIKRKHPKWPVLPRFSLHTMQAIVLLVVFVVWGTTYYAHSAQRTSEKSAVASVTAKAPAVYRRGHSQPQGGAISQPRATPWDHRANRYASPERATYVFGGWRRHQGDSRCHGLTGLVISLPRDGPRALAWAEIISPLWGSRSASPRGPSGVVK